MSLQRVGAFDKRKADVFAITELISHTNISIYSMGVGSTDDLVSCPADATNRPTLLRKLN